MSYSEFIELLVPESNYVEEEDDILLQNLNDSLVVEKSILVLTMLRGDKRIGVSSYSPSEDFSNFNELFQRVELSKLSEDYLKKVQTILNDYKIEDFVKIRKGPSFEELREKHVYRLLLILLIENNALVEEIFQEDGKDFIEFLFEFTKSNDISFEEIQTPNNEFIIDNLHKLYTELGSTERRKAFFDFFFKLIDTVDVKYNYAFAPQTITYFVDNQKFDFEKDGDLLLERIESGYFRYGYQSIVFYINDPVDFEKKFANWLKYEENFKSFYWDKNIEFNKQVSNHYTVFEPYDQKLFEIIEKYESIQNFVVLCTYHESLIENAYFIINKITELDEFGLGRLESALGKDFSRTGTSGPDALSLDHKKVLHALDALSDKEFDLSILMPNKDVSTASKTPFVANGLVKQVFDYLKTAENTTDNISILFSELNPDNFYTYNITRKAYILASNLHTLKLTFSAENVELVRKYQSKALEVIKNEKLIHEKVTVFPNEEIDKDRMGPPDKGVFFSSVLEEGLKIAGVKSIVVVKDFRDKGERDGLMEKLSVNGDKTILFTGHGTRDGYFVSKNGVEIKIGDLAYTPSNDESVYISPILTSIITLQHDSLVMILDFCYPQEFLNRKNGLLKRICEDYQNLGTEYVKKLPIIVTSNLVNEPSYMARANGSPLMNNILKNGESQTVGELLESIQDGEYFDKQGVTVPAVIAPYFIEGADDKKRLVYLLLE